MAVSALCLFHSVPRVGQWYVFMVLPYHTHLLFVLVLLEYPDDYDMWWYCIYIGVEVLCFAFD